MTATLTEMPAADLAAALQKGAEAIHRRATNALEPNGVGAAITFLVGEGDLLRRPEFRQYVTFTGDGEAEVDFLALALWADRAGDPQSPSTYDSVVLARMACVLAGQIPNHETDTPEAENWTLACIFYDLIEYNSNCSTTAAAIAAFAELALGRRWPR